jgi:hypothetical protein
VFQRADARGDKGPQKWYNFDLLAFIPHLSSWSGSMAVERTLSIIKPDAVAANLIGKIYSRFESNGLKIVAAQMRWLSPRKPAAFYAVHRDTAVFQDLVDFMTSGR